MMEAIQTTADCEQPGSQPSSNVTSPVLPLPDFMTALNMKPAEDRETDNMKKEDFPKGELSLGPGPKEALIEKFKQDPNAVLELLQSALSMEKLSNLLKESHRDDSKLLSQLQNRLEAAYHTLRECEENKSELTVKIDETNQRIGEKRKHLETLRGELKILGDEELKLKRRRDISQTKCSDLKKRLQCSTEALEQIAQITNKTAAQGSSSTAANATTNQNSSNTNSNSGSGGLKTELT